MRHFFYIHSFITYIVATSVVSELALDQRNVVFIYGRGFKYRPEAGIKTVELPDSVMTLSKVPSYGERFLVFKRHRQVAELDRLVSELVNGDGFIAYLPLTKNYLMQLLATHPQCRDLVFLEEGMLTYTGDFNKQTYSYFVDTLRGRISRILRYPNHGNRSFFYRRYPYSRPLPVYMLHEGPGGGEPDIDVRVLKSIVVPPLEDRFRIDNAYLLVVDDVVQKGVTSIESFLRVLEFFISRFLKKGAHSLWIRSRPNQPISRRIIDFFEEKSIRVLVLPDDICVESVFYYSRNLTVVGLHSSLLFYAVIFGHKSYSLMWRLFEIDRQAEQRYCTYVRLPHAFYDEVIML